MGAASNSPSQILSLPKGGGALSGIGEKFSPDLHTGTGNFSVPIAIPPGRNGFQPQLTLAYSTGNGNGPFGLGWSLSVPGVSRLTSKGVPRYQEELDVFVLSGAEDLVRVEDALPGEIRYRPRTEGLFARIERHRDPDPGVNTDHWEVASKDGLISVYGTPGAWKADPAVIRDPDPDRHDHVFAWKLTETRDTFGNRILYDYAPGGGGDDMHRWDQIYLDRIRYVDYTDAHDARQFLVYVKFQYEDKRPDPFSERRSGFEIRTAKRCVRIEVHVEHNADHIVRRYDLEYLDQRKGLPNLDKLRPLNQISLLSRLIVTGFGDDGSPESLPPLEFGYSRFDPVGRNDLVEITGSDLPSTALTNPALELVDVTGNGMPDILQMDGVVRWWRNLGSGRFDLPRIMDEAPSRVLAEQGVMLVDADGEGRADLLVADGLQAGYFPMEHTGEWDRNSFIPHRQAPSFILKDSDIKLMDLDGDGITDVLRSDAFLECWFNKGREGWSEMRPVPRQQLSEFPNVPFSDPRVKTADMCGDQLQDIVLVDDGSVVYWPNLGYGNWGRPVHMRNGPRLPYGFDLGRMLIGDVDGDGLADLIYVENSRVTLWINLAGNAWSNPIEITGTPMVTDMDSVRLVDLMGSGVAGVLWSTDASLTGRAQMYFLDLTGGGKPYLLVSMDNHMGSRTRVDYSTSTISFNADAQRARTRWQTTLPFPVQVVSRVIVRDDISRTQLATSYTYHHGHWDGGEREFRGFGRVEQRDTESSILEGMSPEIIAPPLLTKTWFHLGSVGPAVGDWREIDLSGEYWSEDSENPEGPVRFAQDISISSLPMDNGIARRMKRDALRTLRGSVLRTELYAEDGGPLANRPYTITENQHAVREIEAPVEANSKRQHIFFPHLRAQRTTQWERGDDPMTSVAFTDGYDGFGQPTRQTTVALPRRSRQRSTVNGISLDEPNILASHVRTRYVDPPGAAPTPHIADRVCETERFEPAAVIPPVESAPGDIRAIIKDHVVAATKVHLDFMAGRNLKRDGHVRNFYDGPAFVGLSLGRIGKHGALTRTETLVFTDAELDAAYDIRRPTYLDGPMAVPSGAPNVNAATLGYKRVVSGIGHYYADTLRQQLDVQTGAPRGRGLVIATRDPFDHDTHLQHDQYALFPARVTDPVGLVTSAAYSYRVMQPERITDCNGNASIAHYTPLGLPACLFLEGRDGEGGTEHDPEVRYRYDLGAYDLSGDPVSLTTFKRVHHVKAGITDETIRTTDYSDGFGRQIQSRRQAEQVIFGDPVFGNGVVPSMQGDVAADRQLVAGVENTTADPNVVVSGWQRFDNKGRVIEKYEPFFDRGWGYDSLHLAPKGQAIQMRYDPRGQLIRTLNPDGSEQRVIFGIPRALDTPNDYMPTPWESYAYDANDLAPVSTDPRTNTTHAANAPAAHHYTPASMLIDGMGRSLARIERDGALPAKWIVARSAYDVRGNLLTTTDALNRVAFRYAYDLLDRPLRVESIDAGLRTTVLNATGAPVEYRDGRGALVLRTYVDPLNRLTHLWARDDEKSEFTLREVLAYGDGGSTSQQAAARLAARDINQLGRLARHDDEAGRCKYPGYDFKGNSIEKVRRVISDAALAAGWTPDWSQPNSAAALDPASYETSTRFDALNRPIDIVYPADVNGHRAVLKPGYNRAGALEQVALDGEIHVERLAYNARGQRTLIAYGNRMVTRYAYDTRTFRLARLRTEQCQHPDKFAFAPDGNVLQDCTYSYDLVGNILGIDERVKDCGIPRSIDVDRLLRHFEYDPYYRLTRATGRETDAPSAVFPWRETIPYNVDPTRTRGYTENYTYDHADNILSLGRSTARSRTYTPEAANNRLRRMALGGAPGTVFQYSYDANGNMLTETTSRRFFWDHADRMKRFEEGPSGGALTMLARYLCGADGLRVRKWVSKGTAASAESTTYIDGFFEDHRWQDAGNKQGNHLHVMDGQNRVAIVRVGDGYRDDGGESMQYHLGDHLGGSSVVIGGVNAQAHTFINREEYTPYGETSFGSFGRKRYRHRAKERDEESGSIYYGARFFAPWLGRWSSCDPLGDRSGVSLYTFVSNCPISRIDEIGTDDKPVPNAVSQESDFRDNMPLIGSLRRFFGISEGEKRMLNADLEANGIDAAVEGQRMRGQGVEGAGNMLITTGELLQAVVPGPNVTKDAAKLSKTGSVAISSELEAASPGKWQRLKSWVSDFVGLSHEADDVAMTTRTLEPLATVRAPRSLSAAARKYVVKEIDEFGDWVDFGDLIKADIMKVDDVKDPGLLAQLGKGDWVRVYANAEVEVLTAEGTTIEKVEVHWCAPRGQSDNLSAGKLFKRKPED